MRFHPITIQNFVQKYPEGEQEQLAIRLRSAAKRSKAGVGCCICGSSIWVIGSAVAGEDMCFTCMTGEANPDGDYEIAEVCH
jgi:hypothetical protein